MAQLMLNVTLNIRRGGGVLVRQREWDREAAKNGALSDLGMDGTLTQAT